MDRRQFFRRALHKGAEVATKAADHHASGRARHWFRPPYAVNELEFLLACTRCGACSEACPHHVIFPLPARLGTQVVGTPALDLLNKPCRLCDDWPCVTACEPGALAYPPVDEQESTADAAPTPLPKLAKVKIDPARCLPYAGPECGACRGSCPLPDILVWLREQPRIDPERCIGCGACRAACIATPNAVLIETPNQPTIVD